MFLQVNMATDKILYAICSAIALLAIYPEGLLGRVPVGQGCSQLCGF